MALVVEDGTGKTDAESYASVSQVDTYVDTTTSSAAWSAAATGEKEAALRRATQYLDSEYRSQWKGERSNEEQALSWPRQNVVDADDYYIDYDEMPSRLISATCELAIKAISATLLSDLGVSGTIESTKRKVGPVTEEIHYLGGAIQHKEYSLVHGLIADYLSGGGVGGMMRVERA